MLIKMSRIAFFIDMSEAIQDLGEQLRKGKPFSKVDIISYFICCVYQHWKLVYIIKYKSYMASNLMA